MAEPEELLASSLAHFRKAKRIIGPGPSYAKDNPGEWTEVRAYLDGGARPEGVVTEMGLGLLEEEDARRALLVQPEPEPEPEPTPPPLPPPPGEWPATYLTGPLGVGNLLPVKGKAFLSIFPGSIGLNFDQQLQYVSSQEAKFGRKYDAIFAANFPPVWGEDRITRIAARGAIPIIAGYHFNPLNVTQIAAGQADADVTALADHLKTKPRCMLRLFSEFDNPNVPYTSVGREQAFIDAWKRIVEIFNQRGATNVGFFLCPNEGHTRASADLVVAGLPDAYIDWIGVDWYNWQFVGESGYSTWMHTGWAEFWELFQYLPGSNFSNRHDAWGPRKPFFIGETNTVYDPANPSKRAQWYRNVVSDSRALKAMEWCIGIDFYDADVSAAEGAKANFLIDSRGDSIGGFVDMARDPIWVCQGT